MKLKHMHTCVCMFCTCFTKQKELGGEKIKYEQVGASWGWEAYNAVIRG